MSLWSLLFPGDDDRLARARARMAKGQYEKARAGLVHCHAPEAEKLYEECCAFLAKSEGEAAKKQLKAAGFHGWRVEVAIANARRKAELEALVKEEIGRAGIDLALIDVDQKRLAAATGRAQRRFRERRNDARDVGSIRLVPIVSGELARR